MTHGNARIRFYSCFLTVHVHLFRPQQEAQKIFRSAVPIDMTATKAKLLGFGMQLMEGIDPNPENFVSAGIVHTRTHQVGCLLRLEPNRQAQGSTFSSSTLLS